MDARNYKPTQHVIEDSTIADDWSATRKLARNGLMGSAQRGSTGPGKSQVPIAESAAFDRFAFA
jgi:hypothetical protein